jgi:hypothetical protein
VISRTMRRLLFLCWCIGTTLALPAVTLATDEGQDELHIKKGIALRNAGHDREALLEFESALAIRVTPRTRAQIALAHQALGDWVEAELGLSEALRSSSDPWVTRYRDWLQRAKNTVDDHLGSLDVQTDVAGAELFVSGQPTRPLPLPAPIQLPTGDQMIEVRAEGYQSLRLSVTIRPRERTQETVALEPIFPVHALQTAPSSLVGAEKQVGSATVTTALLAARPPPSLTRRTVGVLAFGAAGAFAIGGVAAWRLATSYIHDYNDDSRCLVGGLSRGQRCGSFRTDADQASLIEVGSFVVSGVAALSGVLLLAPSLARSAAAERETPRRLVCAPWTLSGIACSGHF